MNFGNEKDKEKVELDWINKSKEKEPDKWFETSKHYNKPIKINNYEIQWLSFPQCEKIEDEEQINNKITDKFYLLINEIKGE